MNQPPVQTMAMSMVTQGSDHITVAQGGVPVILVHGQGYTSFISAAVNFLRSGCPAVQFTTEFVEDLPRLQEWGMNFIPHLQLPGEKFEFDRMTDDSSVLTLRNTMKV
jgi:hypothetical protein